MYQIIGILWHCQKVDRKRKIEPSSSLKSSLNHALRGSQIADAIMQEMTAHFATRVLWISISLGGSAGERSISVGFCSFLSTSGTRVTLEESSR